MQRWPAIVTLVFLSARDETRQRTFRILTAKTGWEAAVDREDAMKRARRHEKKAKRASSPFERARQAKKARRWRRAARGQ
ncbi:MAG: hypothetical protein ACREVS_04495 [Burkholderiales bacterium]